MQCEGGSLRVHQLSNAGRQVTSTCGKKRRASAFSRKNNSKAAAILWNCFTFRLPTPDLSHDRHREPSQVRYRVLRRDSVPILERRKSKVRQAKIHESPLQDGRGRWVTAPYADRDGEPYKWHSYVTILR
jgi:hypothetical protein